MSARRRRLSLQRMREAIPQRHDVCLGMDLASGPDQTVTLVFISGDRQPLGPDANARRFWVVRP